jgi:glycogen debranching enzyme
MTLAMTFTMEAAAALDELRTEEGWVAASSADGRFASLFGRDALVTALQVLPVDPSVAHATLDRLGAELGHHDDPLTEEEPGKVLHEARDHDLDAYVAHGWPVRDGRLRYYGSVDANPWFLVLVGALARAGEDVRVHLPAARLVADWLARQPMPLAYHRRNPDAGLAHQGWRDVAWDPDDPGHGVVTDDGLPMRTPAALAQVAALAWRALEEAAVVVDPAYRAAADQARAAFHAHFVVGPDEPPAFALHPRGLDRSATSDMGQVLWTGVLDTGEGAPIARAAFRRLLQPDLCTPFGLRTLAATHPAFRPDGYHTGGVWPFDSWLGAGGLDAVEPGAGDDVRHGVVEALTRLQPPAGPRLFPELYVVERDGELHQSPKACTVQAWTVGAVLAVEAHWDGRAWAR